MLAPFLPYATEEVWSWWHDESIHRAAWPTSDAVSAIAKPADPAILGAVGAALAGVRRAKSEAKVGMRADVLSALITGPQATLDLIQLAAVDLSAAGRIAELAYEPAETFAVLDVVLAPVEPKAV
jgi:valyl-tRNA synthetase